MRDAGSSLVELVLALSLVLLMAAVAVPLTASSIDSGRARHAAGFLAGRMRLTKQSAVLRSASAAVVFDQVNGRWTFRTCLDGNGNGLRRAEIVSGQDRCVDGPHDIAAMFPGVQVAVDPYLRGPDGEAGSTDAVRFGRSDLASFSPDGSCTAGTVFLRSPHGQQYAVRVAGVTGRTRLLRYETATGAWSER